MVTRPGPHPGVALSPIRAAHQESQLDLSWPIVLAVADEVDFNPWAPQSVPPQPTTATPRPERPRRRPWRVVYWVTLGLLCAAVVGLIVGSRVTSGGVRVSSSTMAPVAQPGSLVVYQRGAGGVVRGDVVIVHVAGGLLLRRVIGLPGDRVTCCDAAGRVDVDGKALVESYLAPGVAPSQAPFAVTLSPSQVWVMADNRGIAVDSRSWGPLPMSDIVGRAVGLYAAGRWTELHTPETFIADGLAPADHRTPVPLLLFGLTLVAIAAVIVQGTAGTITWAVRRRRRKRRRQAPPSASP